MKSKPEAIPTARDLRFDTLRGLFLIFMTINHLPTELRRFTDQSVGLFSAAEGFVFLSGLMAGWIYTRKLWAKGPRGLLSAALGRARCIYLWHIASFMGAFACVWLTEYRCGFCSLNVPRLFFENPIQALGLGLSLLYQPGLLDLLPMYCVFVLLLPVVIGAIETGRRWIVLSASAAFWLAAQGMRPMDPAHIYPVNIGSFNLFAWQFLFVAGVAIGYERASGRAQVSRLNPWALIPAACTVTYGLGVRYGRLPSLWPDALFGILLNKPALGLLRMADFGCVAYLVAIVGARFPSALTARPLAFLGRHSIVVVATQSVAIMVLLQFSEPFATPLSRTLSAFATVALLFAAAAAAEAFRKRQPHASIVRSIRSRQPEHRGLVRPDDAQAA